MNLLILLVVIIVIAILVGVFYKYKQGGLLDVNAIRGLDDDQIIIIEEILEEKGWVQLDDRKTLICHPDDIAKNNTFKNILLSEQYVTLPTSNDATVRILACHTINRDNKRNFIENIELRENVHLLYTYYKNKVLYRDNLHVEFDFSPSIINIIYDSIKDRENNFTITLSINGINFKNNVLTTPYPFYNTFELFLAAQGITNDDLNPLPVKVAQSNIGVNDELIEVEVEDFDPLS